MGDGEKERKRRHQTENKDQILKSDVSPGHRTECILFMKPLEDFKLEGYGYDVIWTGIFIFFWLSHSAYGILFTRD